MPATRAPSTQPPVRYDRLDAVRGAALVWMAVFHFCFDLAHHRVIDANFYRDPFWTTQRTLILSAFLLCAGAGQAIATAQGQSWVRFWRRWAQVAACAALVSAGSYLMFPRSYIYFGVLHGMAVMLIVARLSAPLRGWLWPLGALAMLAPGALAAPVFDAPQWHWLGLVTRLPITEDYVPVLPWLGVMWWGLAATQWVLARWPHALAPARPPGPALRGLGLLGRWSLTFYMVHQPVLIGGLTLFLTLTRSS